ncbi:hypothetical protein CCH79_00013043 [Gambusia affinis]|uniref:Uncharacterized protein n=1 Tax=Gambusia affinis TaxID=33528 RepID=A0A315WB33_GAMAF|nr:hypothetical protein CCH79_00013043 [Gambusia affinis]
MSDYKRQRTGSREAVKTAEPHEEPNEHVTIGQIQANNSSDDSNERQRERRRQTTTTTLHRGGYVLGCVPSQRWRHCTVPSCSRPRRYSEFQC